MSTPGSVPSLVAALRAALTEGPGLDRAAISAQTAERFGTAAICRRYEDLLVAIAGR